MRGAIHHLDLTVKDPWASCAFYDAVLGFVQRALLTHGLRPQAGPMSTYVVGDDQTVFAALQEAFSKASDLGHVVMTVTVSNTCPIPD